MKTLVQFGDQNRNLSMVLCEWGRQYCCLAGYDVEESRIAWLTYKTYEVLNEETIQAIMDELNSTGSIIVSTAFPESLLTPLGNDGEEALQLVYQSVNPVVALSDNINEWQLKNHYQIPKAIHSAVNFKFSNVSYINFFTASIKVYNGFSEGDQIAVHFSPNQFSVLVKKSGQLQLAQVYRYLVPMDVVYYLLKIVEEFNLSKQATILIISGLIEESSDLYRELYQYFVNLHFAKPITTSIEANSYPAHFFTSIYNLTACVS